MPSIWILLKHEEEGGSSKAIKVKVWVKSSLTMCQHPTFNRLDSCHSNNGSPVRAPSL